MPTNRNTARSTTEFEDMPRHDWPKHLRNLALAASALYKAYVDLDYAAQQIRATVESPEDAGPVMTLVGDAYRLLQAARFEGVSMLAAWESEQQLAAAEDEQMPERAPDAEFTAAELYRRAAAADEHDQRAEDEALYNMIRRDETAARLREQGHRIY